jgi:hypothetical protein
MDVGSGSRPAVCRLKRRLEYVGFLPCGRCLFVVDENTKIKKQLLTQSIPLSPSAGCASVGIDA